MRVYSREFLDFLVTREGLTEFEAATRLGILVANSPTPAYKSSTPPSAGTFAVTARTNAGRR